MLLLQNKHERNGSGLCAHTSMDYSCSLPEPIPDTAVKQATFIFRFSDFPFWASFLFHSMPHAVQGSSKSGVPCLECGLFLKVVLLLSHLALLLSSPSIKLTLKFPSSQLINCEECNVVSGMEMTSVFISPMCTSILKVC